MKTVGEIGGWFYEDILYVNFRGTLRNILYKELCQMKIKGVELQKNVIFVTSKNGGGDSGSDFMSTFCS